MDVLPFTIFFSVLLASIFIFLLCIANWKGWFSKPEQDSLIPLANDAKASMSTTEVKPDAAQPEKSEA